MEAAELILRLVQGRGDQGDDRPPLPATLDRHRERRRVQDAGGQTVGWFYFSRNEETARQAKVLTRDEARRMAVNFARLPDLLGKGDRDSAGRPSAARMTNAPSGGAAVGNKSSWLGRARSSCSCVLSGQHGRVEFGQGAIVTTQERSRCSDPWSPTSIRLPIS